MQDNEGNVREMTRTEKKFFNGVTIDADSTEGGRSSEENFREYNFNTRKTYKTYVSYSNSNIFMRLLGSFVRAVLNGNRLAQIGALLIGLAFAALMFFIALPVLFIVLAIGLALLALAKISR